MSGEGFKFQASVKDSDGDMVNVRADSEAELESNLLNFPVGAYAQFKANVRGGAALGGIVQPQASAPAQQEPPIPSWATGGTPSATPQQQSQGWGAAQQQAPQQSAPQGGGGFAGPPHPEGKQCQCGQVLEYKKTNSGKGVFRCAQWRWNNGNPTLNHDQEWQ